MAGIYVHIPFCKQACYYCDFHFSTNLDLRSELIQSINQELILQKEYLGNQLIETIYFGGGTPSILNTSEIQSILRTISVHFKSVSNPEITIEANPDDLNRAKLESLFEAGINRLSIGIQTFNNSLLQFLHRVHDARSALTCFQLAREVGFKNISIDLIYGMQDESDEVWREDIEQAIALNPEHISCYSLTIEEKTVFGKWKASGKIKPIDDEVAARHLETLIDHLEEAGYQHYEISNFSKPGFHSKHNSSYWKQQPYLGVGPSAHSFNGESRQFNVANNNLYIKSLQQGAIPFEKELLTYEDKINEYILTTLRTHWGTDLKLILSQHGYDLLQQQPNYLHQLLEEKLVILENDILYLTRKGKLLADKISSDLFLLPS